MDDEGREAHLSELVPSGVGGQPLTTIPSFVEQAVAPELDGRVRQIADGNDIEPIPGPSRDGRSANEDASHRVPVFMRGKPCAAVPRFVEDLATAIDAENVEAIRRPRCDRGLGGERAPQWIPIEL